MSSSTPTLPAPAATSDPPVAADTQQPATFEKLSKRTLKNISDADFLHKVVLQALTKAGCELKVNTLKVAESLGVSPEDAHERLQRMKQDHLFAFVNPIKDMQVPLAILTKRGGTINESILPLNYHETKNARVNGKAATKAAAKAAKKAEGSKKPSSKRPKQPDAITSPNKKQKPGNDDAAITVVRLDTEKHDG